MSQYLPARTDIVSTSGSILVRGSIPLHADGSSALLDMVRDAQKQTDLDLSNFPIYVVSLIDNQGEMTMLTNELKASRLTPADIPSRWPPFTVGYQAELKGRPKLLWWPVEAFGQDTPQDLVINQFLTGRGIKGQPGGYDLDGLVLKITELMSTTPPKLVYVHCTLGADRTGAVVFGYLVRHGLSAEAALNTVKTVTTPNADYLRLIEAYRDFLGL